MKTALYEKNFKKTLNERKLVRLNKSTICQSLYFTQRCISFTSRYNATLFLSISMIFLYFSAIACSSSDNNSTYPDFTVNSQKCSYRSRKSVVRMTKQRNRENKETTSIV